MTRAVRVPAGDVPLLPLLLMLLVLVSGIAQAAPLAEARRPVIIERLSADEVKRLLVGEGYAGAEIDEDGDVKVEIQGITGFYLVGDEQDNLQFYAAWDVSDVGLEAVNAWNRSKRYSRAYLDEDGYPVIELDLDLRGGLTAERIHDFFDTVKVSLLYFEREVILGERPAESSASDDASEGSGARRMGI